MIYLYTGVPGSGKSLHAAQDVLDAIRCKSVTVIANFKCNESYFEKGFMKRKDKGVFIYQPNEKLNASDLIKFSEIYYAKHEFSENGLLLVIDEAQLLFNSREWQGKDRAQWIYFFTNSRHFGYKVILITQLAEMLDKQIRSIVEIEIKHRNMANFGIFGKVLSLMCGGKLYACIGYYSGLKQRISVQYVFGRRHLYHFYDSYDVDSFKKRGANAEVRQVKTLS